MLFNPYRCIKKGEVYTWNTLQGEPGPFQKQFTHKTFWNLGGFFALKEFQDLWLNYFAVIATDNTMVVACIKKGGVRLLKKINRISIADNWVIHQ